jgi:hypothetical protein
MSRRNRGGSKKTGKPISQRPPPSPTPIPPPPTVPPTVPPTAWSWLSRNGILALVIATGVAMTGAVDFYVGIALVIGGTLWAVIDLWRDFTHDRHKAAYGSLIIIALCTAFVWHSYTPAPLDVTIVVPAVNYSNGESVLGLEWKPNYFPIFIEISNLSDTEYEAIDGRFVPGGGPEFRLENNPHAVIIGKGHVVGGVNNCVIGRAMPFLEWFVNGRLIPMETATEDIRSNVAGIRCDKISAHSTVQIILAPDHPVRPDWVVGDIQYAAANMHRSSYPTKCVSGNCAIAGIHRERSRRCLTRGTAHGASTSTT